MLADILERGRDQLASELERRSAVAQSTELRVAGRRKRVDSLFQELIEALRLGGIDNVALPSALPSITDPELELRERDLVQSYLMEQIEQKHLEASLRETTIVAEWAARAERKHLCDQNHRLASLLDRVHESAVLLAPDGRILYCNLRATQGLHDLVGVSRSEIVGKTPAEPGIPGSSWSAVPSTSWRHWRARIDPSR